MGAGMAPWSHRKQGINYSNPETALIYAMKHPGLEEYKSGVSDERLSVTALILYLVPGFEGLETNGLILHSTTPISVTPWNGTGLVCSCCSRVRDQHLAQAPQSW